jgi:acyl carrier protein phosphodiesterase
MNFLAHSYLSFNNDELLVGNMISDFVKGKRKYDYSEGIQQGIELHRAIDAFTDDHRVTKEAKEFLKPAVGLYAGAFVDVVYDHFLANDLDEFQSGLLLEHTQYTYGVLQYHAPVLPTMFQQMLPYMVAQNWLNNYQFNWGIERSFGGVVRRAKYLDSSEEVFRLFEKHYRSLENCYKAFFPALKAFTLRQIQQLQRA